MLRNLWHNERGIEGLPIRLVIALVVGIACLSVMMNVIGGFDGLGSTELDTDPQPEIVEAGETVGVEVTVLDPGGDPVQNATVVATGDSAQLNGIRTVDTDENGTATFENVTPELQPNQDRGTIELSIRPPSDGDYTDDRENTGILVIDS
jgi:hypothetical protein